MTLSNVDEPLGVDYLAVEFCAPAACLSPLEDIERVALRERGTWGAALLTRRLKVTMLGQRQFLDEVAGTRKPKTPVAAAWMRLLRKVLPAQDAATRAQFRRDRAGNFRAAEKAMRRRMRRRGAVAQAVATLSAVLTPRKLRALGNSLVEVERDQLDLGLALLEKAHELGDVKAGSHLVALFKQGRHIPKPRPSGINYFHAAAVAQREHQERKPTDSVTAPALHSEEAPRLYEKSGDSIFFLRSLIPLCANDPEPEFLSGSTDHLRTPPSNVHEDDWADCYNDIDPSTGQRP
jgi:hypothetical protein